MNITISIPNPLTQARKLGQAAHTAHTHARVRYHGRREVNKVRKQGRIKFGVDKVNEIDARRGNKG